MRAAACDRRAAARPGAEGAVRGGFTLLEMMLVVALTATLLTFAVAFYVDLSRGSEAATQMVKRERRAAALLDRVARDLEHAALVKKPEARDPLEHPWLFLAESRRSTLGADRLKFDVRADPPAAQEGPRSDLSVVAWFALPGPDEGLELWRWASPQLPERLDRDFPAPEAPGAHRVAAGLEDFGVRLLGPEGSWSDAWDSSTLARSGTLPLAAEITVAFPPEADAPLGAEPFARTRQVLIRTRALDLQARLEGAEEGSGEEEEASEETDCETTLAECLARNPGALDALDAPEEVRSSLGQLDPDTTCVESIPGLESLCR